MGERTKETLKWGKREKRNWSEGWKEEGGGTDTNFYEHKPQTAQKWDVAVNLLLDNKPLQTSWPKTIIICFDHKSAVWAGCGSMRCPGAAWEKWLSHGGWLIDVWRQTLAAGSHEEHLHRVPLCALSTSWRHHSCVLIKACLYLKGREFDPPILIGRVTEFANML